MKLRVLIADDEPLNRQRLRRFLQAEPGIELVAECSTGAEALAGIRQTSPDVAFLDVRMPELDAFGVLEALNGGRVPVVVFVTAYSQYAIRAFEAHAVDYLLKPFDRGRFQTALRHARERLRCDISKESESSLLGLLATVKTRPKPLERLTVKTGDRITLIKVREIDWISSADNYVELHLGNDTHLLRMTLTVLASQLPPTQFVRASRSILINLDRIKEIHSKPHGDYLVLLHNGVRLSGTRSYRHGLAQLLGKFQ